MSSYRTVTANCRPILPLATDILEAASTLRIQPPATGCRGRRRLGTLCFALPHCGTHQSRGQSRPFWSLATGSLLLICSMARVDTLLWRCIHRRAADAGPPGQEDAGELRLQRGTRARAFFARRPLFRLGTPWPHVAPARLHTTRAVGSISHPAGVLSGQPAPIGIDSPPSCIGPCSAPAPVHTPIALNVRHAGIDEEPHAAAPGIGAPRTACTGRPRRAGAWNAPGRVRDRARARRRRLRHRLPGARPCAAAPGRDQGVHAQRAGRARRRRGGGRCVRPTRPRPSRSGWNRSSTRRACWPASTTRRWSRCTAAGKPTARPTWRCSTTPASR